MWDALIALFKELMTVYPDQYFHLGGDETTFWMDTCWENNAKIKEFMGYWGLNSTTQLEQWYFDQLFMHLGLRDMPKKKFIVWQEVVDMGIKLPDGIIAHIWTGNRSEQLADVTKKGHMALLSECW
ncbi:unnamed protein product, partial [Mesorhabditis spiculigera]